MISFKKDRFLFIFFSWLGGILCVLLGCLLILWKIENKENAYSREAYISLQIANELRQSSDDLTKMVRLYVLTGDKKYIDWYEEILSIRNGTSPRPLQYSEIYWDFVLDGSIRPRPYSAAASLQEIMKEYGFSSEEFALLAESQRRSDALVAMELEAINVMQGKFNNGSGDYSVIAAPNPELARELVSNRAYMEEKAKIMFPLWEFSIHLKERIAAKIEELKDQAITLIVTAFCLSIIATILMVVCLLRSINALKVAAKTNEDLLLSLFPASLAKRFKEGEQAIGGKYEGSVLFVHIKHFEDSFPMETLNQVFDRITVLGQEYGVDTAKIIGDTCMVVSGVPLAVKDHAIKLANFALALQENVKKFSEETGLDLNLRMGMASGIVAAGIVGSKRFFYDLWGGVVSLASFLEAFGEMGKIQVSEKMAEELKEHFVLEERSRIGKGDFGSLKTFFLTERK